MIDVANALPTSLSWLVVALHLATGLAALAYCGRALSRYGREARRAEHLEGRTPNLRRGARVTLRGVVRTNDGTPAVTLDVEQHGTEYTHKGRVRHRWTEVARRASHASFALTLGDGTRVRIDGAAALQLVDDLETVPLARDRRVKRAALTHGESAAVTGVLDQEPGDDPDHGGYRGRMLAWVLRATPGSALSSLHLGTAARTWRTFYRWSALGAFVALLGGQALFGFAFTGAALLGEPAAAEVLVLDTYTTRGRYTTTTHFRVTARIVDGPSRGAELRSDLTEASWRGLAVGDRVRWQVVPGHPALAQAGTDPTLAIPPLLLLFLVTLVAAGAAVSAQEFKRPWWERRSLVDNGDGPLT